MSYSYSILQELLQRQAVLLLLSDASSPQFSLWNVTFFRNLILGLCHPKLNLTHAGMLERICVIYETDPEKQKELYDGMVWYFHHLVTNLLLP